jgi:tRNA 2-thiouridine synthesizing protein A
MHIEVDARNLICPMPVLRLAKAVALLKGGDKVSIVANDFGAKQDIPAWCRVHGHEISAIVEADNEIKIDIIIHEE